MMTKCLLSIHQCLF